MSIDLAGALRRHKAQKRTAQLRTRPRSALTSVSDLPLSQRAALVADTNVYIHEAAGTLPDDVADLLGRTLLFHCSVCICEIAVGVANGDPSHPRWISASDHYARLVAGIPASRMLVPDARIWADAGLITGMLARTQGFQPHHRRACLNDALIFLTAAKAGLAVLSSNRDEFDLIQQLEPEGRFVYY